MRSAVFGYADAPPSPHAMAALQASGQQQGRLPPCVVDATSRQMQPAQATPNRRHASLFGRSWRPKQSGPSGPSLPRSQEPPNRPGFAIKRAAPAAPAAEPQPTLLCQLRRKRTGPTRPTPAASIRRSARACRRQTISAGIRQHAFAWHARSQGRVGAASRRDAGSDPRPPAPQGGGGGKISPKARAQAPAAAPRGQGGTAPFRPPTRMSWRGGRGGPLSDRQMGVLILTSNCLIADPSRSRVDTVVSSLYLIA